MPCTRKQLVANFFLDNQRRGPINCLTGHDVAESATPACLTDRRIVFDLEFVVDLATGSSALATPVLHGLIGNSCMVIAVRHAALGLVTAKAEFFRSRIADRPPAGLV